MICRIILIFVLVLLFFPIPLKLSLIYSDSILIFCIYNIQIVNTGKEKQESKKKIKEKKKGIKKEAIRKTKKRKLDIVKLLKSFLRKDSKFLRAHSRIRINLRYGLEDSFNCAMLYGVITSILGVLPNLLNKFVDIKKYSFNVLPVFNTKAIDAKLNFTLVFNIFYIFYLGFFVLINGFTKEKTLR